MLGTVSGSPVMSTAPAVVVTVNGSPSQSQVFVVVLAAAATRGEQITNATSIRLCSSLRIALATAAERQHPC